MKTQSVLITTKLGALELEIWTFDDFEAQICRRVVRADIHHDDKT